MMDWALRLSPEDRDRLQRLISGLEAGLTTNQALSQVGFVEGAPVASQVAACLDASRKYGSSLLPALIETLKQSESDAALLAELEGEFAAPKATIKLVTWLPVGAVLLAGATGLDLVSAIRSPVNVVSIIAGALLVWAATRWSHAILKRAQPKAEPAVAALARLSIVLAAGATARQAIEEVNLDAEAYALIAADLSLARASGSRVLPAITSRISQLNRSRLELNRRKIREAGVKLALPLGVALLPAMILLVVVPMFTSAAMPTDFNS
jgi:tight adherence protein B